MNERVDIIIPTCKKDSLAVERRAAGALITAGIPVKFIITGQDESAAFNRNYGLARARSEIRIMVDDDVTSFPDDWAKNLISVLYSLPECEMVSAFLINPNGSPAVMMGYTKPRGSGVHPAEGPHLISACIAFRRNDLRFDQRYIGSGWEETDYCMQLRALKPDCHFLVHEDVRVVHLNEQKNQSEYFETNRTHFVSKWGEPQ